MHRDAVRIVSCHGHSITFPDGVTPHFTHDETRVALEVAARRLQQGELVAFPTETVYGLGASALSDDAVKRIYEAKRRPADNPLIIHVASLAQLDRLLAAADGSTPSLPPAYACLMRAFWPGPISLLFEAPAEGLKHPLAGTATAGLSTFVVRIPAHPIARALIALADVPVAAPSANTSGRPSPTAASHVADDMRTAHADDDAWSALTILDGGECDVGVESTVVDGVSSPGHLRVLRLGGISPEQLEWCIRGLDGVRVEVEVAKAGGEGPQTESKPRTPGAKYRHYAPRCRVVLLEVVVDDDESGAPTLEAYLDTEPGMAIKGTRLGFLYVEPSRLHWPNRNKPWTRSLGSTAEEHARQLFAQLRAAEEAGVTTVYVELPARAWKTGLGLTVAERIGKAAKGDDAKPEVERVRAA